MIHYIYGTLLKDHEIYRLCYACFDNDKPEKCRECEIYNVVPLIRDFWFSNPEEDDWRIIYQILSKSRKKSLGRYGIPEP